MQRAWRPLPDHHQRHEGRTLGVRLRRWPPRTDLAAVLLLCPGPTSRPLPARWAPATCGSASGQVSPAHLGYRSELCRVTWTGGLSGSVRCPLPSPHSLSQGVAPSRFTGGSGPRLQVFHCLSLNGVSATCGGWMPGRTPDSPGYRVGASGLTVGRDLGTLPCGRKDHPRPGLGDWERPPSLSPGLSGPPGGGDLSKLGIN